MILSVQDSPFLSVMQTRVSTLPQQLQIESQPMFNRLWILQTIATGCCDFIAQGILVRINHFTYHRFINIHLNLHLDLSLLDHVGYEYPCRNSSFNPGNHIHKSVKIYLHLMTRIRFHFFASSYLANISRRNKLGNRPSSLATRPNFLCSLGDHVDSNRFGLVHGREYPGDGLDRVQDPQGVLGSKGYFD